MYAHLLHIQRPCTKNQRSFHGSIAPNLIYFIDFFTNVKCVIEYYNEISRLLYILHKRFLRFCSNCYYLYRSRVQRERCTRTVETNKRKWNSINSNSSCNPQQRAFSPIQRYRVVGNCTEKLHSNTTKNRYT